MKFKVLFPAGYNVNDILNDNVDINIVLESGEVYFAIFLTILNIQYHMAKDDAHYFWSDDILIVKDLSQQTIRETISLTLDEGILERAFTKIGRLGENGLYDGVSFQEIVDMANGYETGL